MNIEFVISTLISVFGFWQAQRTEDRLMNCLLECKVFVKQSLRGDSTEELLYIHQALIEKGDIKLARRLNELISSEFRISEEAYIILESYLESDAFYRQAKECLVPKLP